MTARDRIRALPPTAPDAPRTPSRAAPAETGSGPGWLPLAACCLGTFLLLLYTSIVTVALPGIGAGLGADHGAQQWVIDVYTLALAGLLLGAGAIGDALGSRRVCLAGLAGFTLATLACGLATSPGLLIAARAGQGVAGAAMLATIVPLIGLTYARPGQRATAFAVWGAVAGAASAVGTVCGGVLTEYAGWRWLFLGSLPLCAGALALAARSLPHATVPPPPDPAPDRAPDRVPDPAREPGHAPGPDRAARGLFRTGVDWPGIVLVSVAVTGLAYAVIAGGESGWGAPNSLAGWLAALGAGGGFVLAERRCPRPILPPALVTAPRFAAVLLAAFGYYFAAFGALPALATWMQTGLGLASSAVSLVLVVQLVVFVAVSGLVSRHLHALHPAWTLGAGTILVGVGALIATAVAGRPDWPVLLPFLVLSGVGAGVVSPVLPAVAIATAPPHHAGAAGGAANAVRQLGLTLGVAVCGTLTRTSTAPRMSLACAACALVAVTTGALAVRLLLRSGTR
ncbi:multidrug transporter [Streptomyces sp. SAT1]|uniref:MFS transporter n=1 Tax=Streptomyces sp. SAT1 TaxID=1849967 RepID=UPI0007DD2543|nr:MFS transporter [Streptomyces sp. SAT1]ANH94525.1 multidrug transporter [Streptomyces sp. SAT1]